MKNNFEEISDDFPKLTNTEIRNLLAAFLFTGDDVFKPIQALSGGEKGRVSLAKLMLSSKLLILDEPTNHLDITSKEILEALKSNYGRNGFICIMTVILSIKQLQNFRFNPIKKLVNYIGNYDYYLEKKRELTQIYANYAGSPS